MIAFGGFENNIAYKCDDYSNPYYYYPCFSWSNMFCYLYFQISRS